MIESTGGTQWSVLSQITDGDIGKLPLDILDESSHHRILVESNEDHLGQTGYTGESRERVPDHRLHRQLLAFMDGRRSWLVTDLSSDGQEWFRT